MSDIYKTQTCLCCNGSGKVYDNQKTGKQMRKLRESAAISLRSLSKFTGYSLGYLSELERGLQRWSDELVNKYLEFV